MQIKFDLQLIVYNVVINLTLGLREYLLTKTPSEQLVGRLARRLDPQVIPAVARKLGLTPGEIVRVRDQTAGVSPWHRSFHTLHSVIQKQSVTVGQLQEALVAEGVGPHVLCQVKCLPFFCLTNCHPFF